MAVETILLTYGPLGLWTASLLTERYLHNKKMQTIVENNTIALTKVESVISQCKKK